MILAVCFQEMATEIILTLGEAFEVAYQIALRNQVTLAEGTKGSSAETPMSPGDRSGDAVSAGETSPNNHKESTF